MLQITGRRYRRTLADQILPLGRGGAFRDSRVRRVIVAMTEPIEVLTLRFSFVLGLFPWGGACAPSVPLGRGSLRGAPSPFSFSFLPGSPLGVWGTSSIYMHIHIAVS